MSWLTNNWIWILLAVGFVAMHLFGHGHGHGGHRGPASHRADPPDASGDTKDPRTRPRRRGC